MGKHFQRQLQIIMKDYMPPSARMKKAYGASSTDAESIQTKDKNVLKNKLLNSSLNG